MFAESNAKYASGSLIPQAFTISSEMRTALAVGESGALSGKRLAVAGGGGGGLSAVFGGGASPPHARRTDAANAAAGSANARFREANRTLIGSSGFSIPRNSSGRLNLPSRLPSSPTRRSSPASDPTLEFEVPSRTF